MEGGGEFEKRRGGSVKGRSLLFADIVLSSGLVGGTCADLSKNRFGFGRKIGYDSILILFRPFDSAPGKLQAHKNSQFQLDSQDLLPRPSSHDATTTKLGH